MPPDFFLRFVCRELKKVENHWFKLTSLACPELRRYNYSMICHKITIHWNHFIELVFTWTERERWRSPFRPHPAIKFNKTLNVCNWWESCKVFSFKSKYFPVQNSCRLPQPWPNDSAVDEFDSFLIEKQFQNNFFRIILVLLLV